MPSKKSAQYAEETSAIIGDLNVLEEYKALGVEFATDKPRASGMISCRAHGREDNKPSGWVNVNTGYYGESSSDGSFNLSLFDFAAKFGPHADWKEARRHYAKKAGIKLGKGKRPDDPTERLIFEEWDEGNNRLAKFWCEARKKGISVEAIKRAGGRIAHYPCWIDKETGKKRRDKESVKVIAIPCYGEDLLGSDPVAWVLWNVGGGMLKVSRGKGQPPGYVKMKSLGPTAGTLMNHHAIERLDPTEREEKAVFKTAGPVDMLALMSAIPPGNTDAYLVTTNASGETGDVPHHVAQRFAGRKVYLVHDADAAGIVGLGKWIKALQLHAREIRSLKLYEEIAQKGGKDLRDWFLEGHLFAELVALANGTEPEKALSAEARAGLASDPTTTSVEELICKRLRIDVLGEYETNGAVKIFSEFHRKSHVERDVGRLSFQRLLQICGPPAKEFIFTGQEEPPPDMYRIKEVKDAIGLLAGYKRIGDRTELGLGCWQGLDEDENKINSVILVGAGEAAEWNGQQQLERITHPRCRSHLIDISGSDPWYDFQQLETYLKNYSQAFAEKAINEAVDLFSRWKWRKQEISPFVVTSLVMSTWVQTLWNWRPQVALIGASKAGKTMLFKTLEKMFGSLSILSSQSSAAGLRQIIKSSAGIVLCDEFENSHERPKILEMLRSSGRGDKIYRGTSGQVAQEFLLQHIVWVAAIEVNLKREPDRNRFIMLDLLVPSEEQKGKLTLPSEEILRDLGTRLLVVAIKSIEQARKIATDLRSSRFENIDDRIIESYAAPAAMLSVACGEATLEKARENMKNMLEGVEKETASEADEKNLLSEIFSSSIRLPAGRTLTVSQIVSSQTEHNSYSGDLEGVGIAMMIRSQSGGHGSSHSAFNVDVGSQVLFIADGAVKRHLLARTEWDGQDLRQILRRIPGAKPTRRVIAGSRQRGVEIPMDYVFQTHLNDEE